MGKKVREGSERNKKEKGERGEKEKKEKKGRKKERENKPHQDKFYNSIREVKKGVEKARENKETFSRIEEREGHQGESEKGGEEGVFIGRGDEKGG